MATSLSSLVELLLVSTRLDLMSAESFEQSVLKSFLVEGGQCSTLYLFHSSSSLSKSLCSEDFFSILESTEKRVVKRVSV
jgi:hypothetical protein